MADQTDVLAMAKVAKALGHPTRLAALLSILESSGKISAREVWPEAISLQMRSALLRDLRPFLDIHRLSKRSDALYSISAEFRGPLENLMAALEAVGAPYDMGGA